MLIKPYKIFSESGCKIDYSATIDSFIVHVDEEKIDSLYQALAQVSWIFATDESEFEPQRKNYLNVEFHPKHL